MVAAFINIILNDVHFFGSSFTTSNAPRSINIMIFQFGLLKVLATKQLNTFSTVENKM